MLSYNVHIEAEVSMVDVASLMCFTKLCKNILILTKLHANAQRVVKGVVIPNCEVFSGTVWLLHHSSQQACATVVTATLEIPKGREGQERAPIQSQDC